MITTTATLAPGTVVDARPWVSGTELDPQRGIVLAPFNAEYVLVWFPGMCDGEIVTGKSVQPILVVKARMSEPRPLADLPKAWVRQAYTLARAANRAGLWTWFAAGAAIQTAARKTR
jgi:hypothetical protein